MSKEADLKVIDALHKKAVLEQDAELFEFFRYYAEKYRLEYNEYAMFTSDDIIKEKRN